VDLTRVLAGPFCAMALGDMGAEVIKVEEPGRGDDTRGWPPFVGGEATYFLSVNRSKKSLTLNLKAPEGQGLLRRLIARADVLLENFRPGTMERLGFGWEALRRRHPRLVYCSVSGFGESGPEASRPGYDLIVQGESGIMDLTGFPDGPPVKVGNSIADLVSGMAAAHGVALALLARERTGRGQKVEIGMLDVMASLLAYQAGLYWNNSLWARFCEAIGLPALTADPRFDTEARRVANRDALIPLLDAELSRRPAQEWLGRLDRAGVPAGRIKTVPEVCESEHLRARGMVVTLQHPKAGPIRAMGVPIRLWATPGAAMAPPPLLGQHTDEILTGLLGLSRARVERLRAAGVV